MSRKAGFWSRAVRAACIGGLSWWWAALGAVAAEPVSESEVKAVMLFHLTEFVTWPVSPKTDVFTIGVLGPDPFGEVLDLVVKPEKLGSLTIVVKPASTVKDLLDCQIIYVSPNCREPLRRVFAALNSAPILTIGEASNFLAEGGMVRFNRVPSRKIRLQIDLEHVRRSGLKMSAQLLRVADVIRGGEQ